MSSTTATGTETVLVFGPQALGLNEDEIRDLRSRLVRGDDRLSKWAITTLCQLPRDWESARASLSSIRGYQETAAHLESLKECIQTGSTKGLSFPLPNALLTPLVVTAHILQYSRWLAHVDSQSKQEWSIASGTSAIGLCTGQLSATAIALSKSWVQLEKYGTVAVRLAAIIGAVVDADEGGTEGGDPAGATTITWNPLTTTSNQLNALLQRYSADAYTSVVLDENRMTITASRSVYASIVADFRKQGVVCSELPLRGRFHSGRHSAAVKALLRFCDETPAYQFPDASALQFPLLSSVAPVRPVLGALHQDVVNSMLLQPQDWHSVFASLSARESSATLVPTTSLIFFGTENPIPNRILRDPHIQFIRANDTDLNQQHIPIGWGTRSGDVTSDVDDNGSLAIIGMAGRMPGAEDLEGFWNLLCRGESQHQEVPASRFSMQTPWRPAEPDRRWYGNFISDHDAFDHKFFRKTPREMASADPQHRLMLQTAYQALEQAGYFTWPLEQQRRIGCFIGIGMVDYERNIACRPASAYAATGTLKAFTAGKISHYFGWTGPSLTVDTACSTSAVALHLASQAIRTGECDAVLVGGVNIMTSPEWFQNLAGASFLSTSGQCKPFDAAADGYCRGKFYRTCESSSTNILAGEAVGAIVLKRIAAATRDHDQVLAVVRSTAVWQNENHTAITVPNAPSLSGLFDHVIQRAALHPSDISYVEAHGTGTPVGDPAEYDGIRRALAGAARKDSLMLGSVKGLIGHTEAASGMASLMKAVLMIQAGQIPPQASFNAINPGLGMTPSDNIEIVTRLRPWERRFKAVLINNYGASGSNASMIVAEAPASAQKNAESSSNGIVQPFWLCGSDERSLQAYVTRLRDFVRPRTSTLRIDSLAFQISRQSNRSLNCALTFACATLEELMRTFDDYLSGSSSAAVHVGMKLTPQPVVLCFGGQVRNYIGLDRNLYDQVGLLRAHLDRCDELVRAMGHGSIFPKIFQKTPVESIVTLQAALFATQYACARCWLDCGVQPVAVVGFSFGELTALCISGVLTLEDALRLVLARAELIEKTWSADRGAMVAIDGPSAKIQALLDQVNADASPDQIAEIACFNSPTSCTVAGPAVIISRVIAAAALSDSPLRTKALTVTHAFHSCLVTPLMPALRDVGRMLVFREPTIPIELATEEAHSGQFDADYVANHMRNPVFFACAVRRLAERFGHCTWLEAGSGSGITNLASRSVPELQTSHFQPVDLSAATSNQQLTQNTLALWRRGLDVTFWPHHASQRASHDVLMLPPYQFEKSRHWMELLDSPIKTVAAPALNSPATPPPELWSFLGYRNDDERTPRFRINMTGREFQEYVSGHRIAGKIPLCPSTLQAKIALDTLASVRKDADSFDVRPQIEAMVSHAPLTLDHNRDVFLDAEFHPDREPPSWSWQITSSAVGQQGNTTHVSGRILLVSAADARQECSRYERLISASQCAALLADSDPDEVLTGRKLYRRFEDVVTYSSFYHGLQKLVAKRNQSAGRVLQSAPVADSLLDVAAADAFCQVAGIFLNVMGDVPDTDMFISDRIDRWIAAPGAGQNEQPRIREVFAVHDRPSDRECLSDVFVFDPTTGSLVEAILGIHYMRVAKESLIRMLSRLDRARGGAPSVASPGTAGPDESAKEMLVSQAKSLSGVSPSTAQLEPKAAVASKKTPRAPGRDVARKAREVISTLSGVDVGAIKMDAELADLGIDSLMAMELARELDAAFEVNLPRDELYEITDFHSLVAFISMTLGETADATDSGYESPLTEDRDPAMTVSVSQVSGAALATPRDAWPSSVILSTFGEIRKETDRFVQDGRLARYCADVLPKSNELCTILIADAFEALGCSLRTAPAGTTLPRILHEPKHRQYVDWIYGYLEHTARLIDTVGSSYQRTNIAVSRKQARALLQEMLTQYPEHAFDQRLTALMGEPLANFLRGKQEGVQVMFGTAENRAIANGMYGESPINVAWIRQMEAFLKSLLPRLPASADSPVQILELGAGTGGTTGIIIPMLASLGVPVRYMVTDLSPSLVAAARKRFKAYPFVECAVFDIERPQAELKQSMHIILATNCVHATHRLGTSLSNIRTVLRDDGFLLMLEMTEPLPWIDVVCGPLEGWWLFEDGRRRALSPVELWNRELENAGYSSVDWTDGSTDESQIQRLILAMASGQRYERPVNSPVAGETQVPSTDFVKRQRVVDGYVREYTQSWTASADAPLPDAPRPDQAVVLVTGASGSLGTHLAAHLVGRANTRQVVCLNRCSARDPRTRQWASFHDRHLALSPTEEAKIEVFEADAAAPLLGLEQSAYDRLISTVTDIVHNAWPMSLSRNVGQYAPQFRTLRNLLDLATAIHERRAIRVGFQFISSIATVGTYPLDRENRRVPEGSMTTRSVLPSGYGDAKLVCELMLMQTLALHPQRFRAMVVRIAQIAGATTSGYWNPVEHLAAVLKSSQTLRALPDLPGDLSWAPVDAVASTLTDLLATGDPHTIYHIENPSRQSWPAMVTLLQKTLSQHPIEVVPFAVWIRRVRQFPGSRELDNPAGRIVDFLAEHFLRMDAGGLVLDTAHTQQHSPTLRDLGPVDAGIVQRYVEYWKQCGHLV